MTYLTFITKVKKDLDLEGEEFIQADEFLGYTNEALREAAAEVVAIYEDYFLTSAFLSLVNGTSTYSLPTGIYASKIRGIIYDNGSVIYEVRRIRSPRKFLERSLIRTENPTDYYSYIILNSSASGFQIELSPAAKETSSTVMKVWFLRDVDEVDADADVVDKDIPESLNFLFAYVKGKCRQKENMGNMPADAQLEIDRQRKLLVETLSTMVPDDDNEVLKDMSFYEEMS